MHNTPSMHQTMPSSLTALETCWWTQKTTVRLCRDRKNTENKKKKAAIIHQGNSTASLQVLYPALSASLRSMVCFNGKQTLARWHPCVRFPLPKQISYLPQLRNGCFDMFLAVLAFRERSHNSPSRMWIIVATPGLLTQSSGSVEYIGNLHNLNTLPDLDGVLCILTNLDHIPK